MINPNNIQNYSKIFGIIRNPNTFKLFKLDYYSEYYLYYYWFGLFPNSKNPKAHLLRKNP